VTPPAARSLSLASAVGGTAERRPVDADQAAQQKLTLLMSSGTNPTVIFPAWRSDLRLSRSLRASPEHPAHDVKGPQQGQVTGTWPAAHRLKLADESVVLRQLAAQVTSRQGSGGVEQEL
jgi:hypothetical protein